MIPLLDHGLVRLVDHMGSDLSIVRAARVSYDAAWRAGEDEGKDAKLIGYLLKNRHTSPFEAVTFTFEVKAPIFVFRQWHRHRTWCIAGGTPLVFNRPSDGKAYRKSLADVVKSFNNPSQRARLMSMGLRGPDGLTQITDAWHSGEKRVYRLRTKHGDVVASADHVFKTPTGSAKISDSPGHVMALVRVGGNSNADWPEFTSAEIASERWVEFADGYEVSDLGFVRSYWGQGARKKRATPVAKQPSISSSGRAVVSVSGRAVQVSRLVAEAFLGSIGDAQVLHRDDNPLHNRASNLYMGAAKDNSRDQYTNGGRVRMREVPVEVIDISAAGTEDTFDITVTGDHWFAANNLIVHNSFNEVSARYAELPEEFYVPAVDQITTQSNSNKQMRTTEQHPRAGDWAQMIATHCSISFDVYRSMLADGVPRELARGILPVNTYSHMFATIDLHNLFHFLTLRLHEHAQHEIRVYAEAMLDLIEPIVPVAVAAFRGNRG